MKRLKYKDRNGVEVREGDVIRYNENGDVTEADVILENGELDSYLSDFFKSGVAFEIRGNWNEDFYAPSIEPDLRWHE